MNAAKGAPGSVLSVAPRAIVGRGWRDFAPPPWVWEGVGGAGDARAGRPIYADAEIAE